MSIFPSNKMLTTQLKKFVNQTVQHFTLVFVSQQVQMTLNTHQ